MSKKENVQMKTRRVSFEEIQKFSNFLVAVSELAKELDWAELGWNNSPYKWEDYPELDFIAGLELDNIAFQRLINYIRQSPFEIILFNLITLLENCADLDKKTLEFNPEIEQGFEAVQKLREIDSLVERTGSYTIYYRDDFYLGIKEILSKHNQQEND